MNGCNQEKNRIIYLDIARTFAIIFVVLCHSVELIYKMNLQGENSPDEILEPINKMITLRQNLMI